VATPRGITEKSKKETGSDLTVGNGVRRCEQGWECEDGRTSKSAKLLDKNRIGGVTYQNSKSRLEDNPGAVSRWGAGKPKAIPYGSTHTAQTYK